VLQQVFCSLPTPFVDDMNTPLIGLIHTRSLSTTLLSSEKLRTGNAERLPRRMTSSLERSSSFVRLLYVDVKRDELQNRSHPASNLEYFGDRSAAAAFAATGAGSQAIPVHPLWSGRMANDVE
jgi:hypothetical protein